MPAPAAPATDSRTAHHDPRPLDGSDPGGDGRILVVVTLAGGLLIVASLAARLLFAHDFHHGILALLAALLVGTPLVARALGDLLAGRAAMNELVALAVLAAFAAGQYLTAAAIGFFMLVTGLLESRAALGARRTIESLVRLTPTRASRLAEDGSEETVDAGTLRPGDVVRVRPGDSVPGDGVVIAGASTIDQSHVTGESLPVDKGVGDEVFGGTINETGVLDVRITSAGAETTLGRVQKLVLEAARSRTPVMRLADRYAHWYTPVVLMVAVIVLVFTRELDRVIALLVIACPYSLILAAPTAVVAALGAAARLGILVKNIGDLERARDLSAVLFDKTGTLTTGRLTVAALAPARSQDAEELLTLAASAERSSRHPLARAILRTAERAGIETREAGEFEEVPGRGVRARIGGDEVLVGRRSWLEERGLACADAGPAPPDGCSLLHVARGGEVLGWIALEDRTRPDAAEALAKLRALGVRKLVMVTGDRRSVAERVARETGCSDLYADVLPKEKLAVVEALRRAGHRVAVVGDGVNDAPALAAGDLSVAMGAAGSDVAIHSASVALMNNQLDRIPFLFSLARRTARVVVQGIAFSLGCILLFGVLSAAGKIHPVVAAVLQSVSSLVVVLNSARLIREGEGLSEARVEEPVAAASRAGGPAAVAQLAGT